MRALFIFAILIFAVSPQCIAAQNVTEHCARLQENLDSDRLVIIQGYMSGHDVVGVGRVYFYLAPSDDCKTEVFVIPGDTVDVYEEYEGFSSVNYINLKTGNSAQGWVQSKRLQPNGFGIAPKQ